MIRSSLFVACAALTLGCPSTKPSAGTAPSSSTPAPPPEMSITAQQKPPDSPMQAVETSLLPGQIIAGVDLRETMHKRMDHYGVRAVGVAVIDRGKVQWAHTWGPGTNDETLFQAASISKPLTAVAVLRLVEQKKLDLDADVRGYLKSWRLPDPARKVTLRKLLSHTAGLNAPEQILYASIDGGYAPGEPLPTTAQILSGTRPAKSAPVAFLSTPPGTFSYSGGGYAVIQQILEDVTGGSFADALKTLVLAPVGMKHSTFDVIPATANAAHAYGPGGIERKGGWIIAPEKAAGGLWTTPSDLALFLADLMASQRGEDGHLLTPAMMKQMLTPVADARPTVPASIGLGMFVSGENDGAYFKHDGHNPGFWATMLAMPAVSKGVIIMLNREDAIMLLNEVGFAVGTVYGWPEGSLTRPRKRDLVAVAADVLAGYAGTYDGADVHVTVKVAGDKLVARVSGGEETAFYPVTTKDFLAPWAPAALKFKDGAVVYDSPAGKHEAARAQP